MHSVLAAAVLVEYLADRKEECCRHRAVISQRYAQAVYSALAIKVSFDVTYGTKMVVTARDMLAICLLSDMVVSNISLKFFAVLDGGMLLLPTIRP